MDDEIIEFLKYISGRPFVTNITYLRDFGSLTHLAI